MAFAPLSALTALRGQFVEAEHGNYFEYAAAAEGEFLPFPDYPVKVFVGGNGAGGDQGFRWAKLAKTRAYIVTDEDADGAAVAERWVIRNHREYAR
jgi:hypothetical protein